jgi:hypothetical protein
MTGDIGERKMQSRKGEDQLVFGEEWMFPSDS